MTLRSRRRGHPLLALAAGFLMVRLLAAESPPPPAGSALTFAADVPLIESAGVPCVSVRIGDGPELLFGIDTGNVNTSIDAGVAKAAGLVLTAIPRPAPAGFYKALVPALHLGGVAIEGRPALVFDFAANQMPPRMTGTLAYTAFKDRVVQIDYVAHRVRISGILSGPVTLPGPSDHFSLITFGKDGPPIVVAKGFELEGKAVSAQVDSMYTGSLLIYSASLPRLGLEARAKTGATEFFAQTDGGVNMKVAPARQESFRGIRLGRGAPKVYFPTAGVHEPDGLFDATVGIALFRDAVLTLDFHDDVLSVARPVR